MSKEEWRDVKDFEGLYQVSNAGRVKRIAGGMGATPGHILKLFKRPDGYLEVTLCRGGKRKHTYVHRLVAKAFLGNAPSPKHQINHKNGDKADNRVENLEWVTPSENNRHAYRVLGKEPTVAPLKGEAHGSSILTRQQVIKIRQLSDTGEHTQRELAEMFGVGHVTIGDIVRRETWKHIP